MRTVTIKIISDRGESQPNSDASNGNGNRPRPNAKGKNKEKTDGQVIGAYMARRAYYYVKGISTHYVSKYFDAAELYRERTMMSNAIGTIDSTIDLFTSGIVGAKLFGDTALGGAGGFAIGAAIAALTKVTQRFQEISADAQSLVNSAYGNYFNATRAGFVAGGHNTEN